MEPKLVPSGIKPDPKAQDRQCSGCNRWNQPRDCPYYFSREPRLDSPACDDFEEFDD
jgi:hypothetical protein